MPMPKVLHALCVEDVPEDVELYLRVLQDAGYQVTADVVSSREEFASKLESGSYDVVLSDYRMPGWSGAEALEDLKRSAQDIPFLLVTGTIGEEVAAEFIKQGAADYILKDQPTRLPAALRRALEEKALREERVRVEESLKLFRLLVDQSNDSIQVVDLETMRFLDVNARACLSLGYTREELLSMRVYDIDSTVDESVRARLGDALRKSGFAVFQTLQRRKDGSTFPVEVSMKYVHLDRSYVVCAVRDITERKQAEEALRQAEEKYRRIFEQAVVGIFQTTPDGRILSANPAQARLFGYDSPAELMAGITDIAHEVYVDPGERELLKRQLEKNGSVHDLEYQGYRKDGSKIWLLENACAVHDSSGATLYYEGTVVDITDRKATEERVRYLAYYDPLTGLPNRILLRDRLTKAFAAARRHKEKVAILFLDLDRFKDINDTFGHSSGDLLLQDVAERLKRCVREQDTVARLSGDEFLIALTDIKDNSNVAVSVKRFMDAMTPEFIVRGQSLGITFSLGISMFPEHGADGETLIKNADAAMYCAKDSGRANVQFFTNASERCQTESSGLR